MQTQTKCTLAICSLFIIELLPIPFSSIYSLYVVRKRPKWLPQVVKQLYEEQTPKQNQTGELLLSNEHDYLTTQKKCTVTLLIMFMIDLLIPVVIPTALYVVRKKPTWFRILVANLYADQKCDITSQQNLFQLDNGDQKSLADFERKLQELDSQNLDYAKFLSGKRRYA